MEANRWSLSDYLQIGFCGFPFGGLMSIDVTYRCNLHCLHCYFSRQDYTSELSAKEWIAQLERMRSRSKPLYICGWLGGEPLLRPDVIETGRKFFKSNIIFTNGTLELPSWPDCTFVVSVPGTKIHYQEITGADDKVYDLVKDHEQKSFSALSILMTVNSPVYKYKIRFKHFFQSPRRLLLTILI